MIEEVLKDKILEEIYSSDYRKGEKYNPNLIRIYDKNKYGKVIDLTFLVRSENSYRYYFCNIEVNQNNNEIHNATCTCPQYLSTGSCKHLAACLIHYQNEIFYIKPSAQKIELITSQLFETLKTTKNQEKKELKEEVKLEINLSCNNNDANIQDELNVSLKIGTDKLYVCNENKLSNLINAIENEEEYYFGKNFTFNPNKNYFSKENQKIIDYFITLKNMQPKYYSANITTIKGKGTIKNFLNLVSNHKIRLNNYLINNYENSFPIKNMLVLENDKYKLKFDYNTNLYFITSDLEYLQIENTIYHLNKETRNFFMYLLFSDLEELIFSKDKKDDFVNNLLPVLKDKIDISDDITDIKISKVISSKLFFDLYKDMIICNLKLYYDDMEIDYFDNNSNIIRDKEYEDNIIDDLYKYNFIIKDNKIVLDFLEDIAYFLEEGLIDISSKYDTYTSEKLKSINIVKKSNVRSTFSIGTDNIMSYSFDLGDIDPKEVVNILESLKDKKKYYKLKSGDILNLEEDTDIQELEKLTEDMNISKKDLEKGSGVIPKYRAIYLDSLKNNKYHIIKTNNLFDELMDKFNKYKDSNISLTKEDKEILRYYQVEGIKWLYNIDKTGFGGILADEMGLGKSIQTIYYIKELLKENKDYKFLIVAPTSLAYNWENEFKKFAPDMKYEVLSGIRTIRRELFNKEDVNIYITTYGLLREDKEYYLNMNFKTMIIDEAQNIKNPNTEITNTVKSIKADTRIALTGTPIENSISELWSIFDYSMPGFLTSLQVFEKKYRVKDFDDETNEKLEGLNKLVSPFILRRRKKDVILELPPKIENNIYVSLTTNQKKVYLAELEKVNREMDSVLNDGGISRARFLILKLLTKLRQICIDPRIIYPDYKGGSGKLEEFIRVVSESVTNGHKILIFTSFKSALDLAREELLKENITSYVIDGSVSSKKRMDLVDKFNSDETNVFFIMLKAGGTGLNLTSADIVIHLDLWWNPQAENQATDRAHRIGQKNVVEVIRFITKGTIEEKILDLQNKKKILSDKLIDENKAEKAFSKLTEKDIKDLLSYENKDEE